MAYTQKNNPLPRKSSPLNFGPRGMQKMLDSVRGAHNKLAADPYVDLSYNPRKTISSTFLRDDKGNPIVDENLMANHQDYEGQYGGMVNFGSSQNPHFLDAKSWRDGDRYVNQPYLHRTLSFDPEKGYSARPLDIYYDKSGEPMVDEQGYERYTTPNSGFATIGNMGSGMYSNYGNRAPGLDLAKDRKFDLSNTKDREEFERYRDQMYENQQNMLQYANAMYALGEDGRYSQYSPDERRGYTEDALYDRVDPRSGKTRHEENLEKLYNRQFSTAPNNPGMIGAPGSDERARVLEFLNNQNFNIK